MQVKPNLKNEDAITEEWVYFTLGEHSGGSLTHIIVQA